MVQLPCFAQALEVVEVGQLPCSAQALVAVVVVMLHYLLPLVNC